jgi:16S rRNA (guanine966-N2)-methyltransferase
VRVIAGRLGGRPLRAPRGRATRPTSDLVREALFALLGDVEHAVVLDLFAGTGALGIEALSRGARRAVFVEQDAGALRALRANLTALAIARDQAQVRQADVLEALRTARRRREKYDLVLVDPPYARARALGPRLSEALGPVLSPVARVAVESDRREPLALELDLQRQRRYGDTSITIHRNR